MKQPMDTDADAQLHEERVVAVRRNVICILCSTREMYLLKEFKIARANLSYSLKVNEFTDFDNQ